MQRLRDTWSPRDFPVLLAAAEMLERGEQPELDTLSEASGQDREQVILALQALQAGDYLEVDFDEAWGSFMPIGARVNTLGERGRRAVGLWPSEEIQDDLVEALRQAEAATADPEERTQLRRAAAAVLGVGRDVMTDVMAAVISKQAGLG